MRTGLQPAMARLAFGIAVGLAILAAPRSALADGAVVRLRSEQGPLVLRVYAPSRISSAAPVELAALVQRTNTGELVRDATVEFRFTPPRGATLKEADVFCGPAEAVPRPGRGRGGASEAIVASPGAVWNPLFHGARVRLREPGEWTLQVTVRDGTHTLEAGTVLEVGGPVQRLLAIWPSLLLPPLGIALFGINRLLRRPRPPGRAAP